MKNPLLFLVVFSGAMLSACSTIMENLPGIYKLDIQQGNLIDQETIDQLRPGMSKRQVLYVIGSPMLIDVFHQQQWDYIFSEQKGGEPRMQKRISLLFDGDNLAGVQGDFKPSSKPVEKVSHESTVELPRREFEKTLWEMITGLFDFDEPETTKTITQNTEAKPIEDQGVSESSTPKF